MVKGRVLLISILVAALVALAALSQLREVRQAGFEWTPGIITVIVLILAVTGHPFAWAVSFVFASLGTFVQLGLALNNLDEPSRLAITGLGVIVLLALWGLKPEDEPAPAPPGQG